MTQFDWIEITEAYDAVVETWKETTMLLNKTMQICWSNQRGSLIQSNISLILFAQQQAT